ncbi:DUF3857 domain-containing protein [Chitinophaga sp. MM2321]|uniref:DUF3857 domain-containing protein n=1 Tax=Chitinophaga sp. MM2321 TaxID=3137178 RepID=UPI0032D573C8
MKHLIFFLAIIAVIAVFPLHTKAQINNYFPETWKDDPHVSNQEQTLKPYTILEYRIARDFNITSRDKADAYTNYKTIYKKVRINTTAGADSLTQLVLSMDTYEALRSFRVRVIFPDGKVANLNEQTRTVKLSDGRQAIVVNDLSLQSGCELEYEMNLKIQFDIAGTEYLQSGLEAQQVQFTLVAPKSLQFLFKSVNGVPAVTDSTAGNNVFHNIAMQQVPGLVANDLFFYMPQLQRVDFALSAAISGRDTSRVTWQDFGEEAYVPYVAVSKAEYKQLEKELSKWPFLAHRMPVPQLIYQVEQYIKTNYTLRQADDVYEAPNLTAIIRSKSADKAGMVRLMTAAYYMLNIPVQMLFTSARDTLPLDKNIINKPLAKNILLYFPNQQQALAPTETDTRFPCYPPLWANCLALRCRDTLAGTESKVLTDFINTPVPAYTLSNITTEATLRSLTDPAWEVNQSFGGYAAESLKTAFTKANNTELRNSVLNAVLPFAPGTRRPAAVEAHNETFNNVPLSSPVVITSTLHTPGIAIQQGTQLNIKIGQLLGGNIDYNLAMPGGTHPIQISFPYYQEKRVHIDIPAGYKVANKADFAASIEHNTGSQPALGFKMRCEQENNRLNIYTIEWYSQTDYTGEDKKTFEEMIRRLKTLQQQELILTKE